MNSDNRPVLPFAVSRNDTRTPVVQRAGLRLFEKLIATKKLKKDAVYFLADDFLTVGGQCRALLSWPSRTGRSQDRYMGEP